MTIADHIEDVMREQGLKRIWAGDPNTCHEIYERFGGKRSHPLNRIKSVIDAARRSPKFSHGGYIRACDGSGRREILHPTFVLSAINDKEDQG